MINIALSRTFLRTSPICGAVSILPRVDLLENTEVDWFCILSLFRLDTLHVGHLDLYVKVGKLP